MRNSSRQRTFGRHLGRRFSGFTPGLAALLLSSTPLASAQNADQAPTAPAKPAEPAEPAAPATTAATELEEVVVKGARASQRTSMERKKRAATAMDSISAEDVGSYKPAHGHWTRFAELTGASTGDTIHIGASQYHDMVPAAALGYRTVFIDRHGEPLTSSPTRVLRNLSGLPRAIAELE